MGEPVFPTIQHSVNQRIMSTIAQAFQGIVRLRTALLLLLLQSNQCSCRTLACHHHVLLELSLVTMFWAGHLCGTCVWHGHARWMTANQVVIIILSERQL